MGCSQNTIKRKTSNYHCSTCVVCIAPVRLNLTWQACRGKTSSGGTSNEGYYFFLRWHRSAAKSVKHHKPHRLAAAATTAAIIGIGLSQNRGNFCINTKSHCFPRAWLLLCPSVSSGALQHCHVSQVSSPSIGKNLIYIYDNILQ